jgi:glycosyltransferase involved in cell wall biosynthesis
VANSQASAEAYRAAGGRNPRVHVLYNGFNLERFSPVSPESAREALPAPLCADAPVVGLFGRVTPWKGQHVLIEALALLPGVHALIVGDALFTEEDRRYRQELETLAERLGVRERVHFTGFLADIRPLVCAVDAVVHCSVAPEPFGRVVVEAMLLGRPLVAAAAGGVLELVHDGRTGLLTEPADAPALARAVRSLLENPDRAQALGRAARQEARDRFGLKQIISRWDAWIAGLAIGAGQEELRCA